MSSSGKIEWELWYWPLKNRGNYIQLLFAETETDYKLIIDPQKVRSKIRSTYFGTLDANDPDIIYQPMAPPFIVHHDPMTNKSVRISQTEHCVGYIAEKLNLRPKNIENHYRAQMIVANCNELFGDLLLRMSQSQIDGGNAIKLFVSKNGRLNVWLSILQNPLTVDKEQKFYFENKICQCDLAVFNILNGLHELFGDHAFNKLVKLKYPLLARHYDSIGNRDSIKRLMIKQRRNNILWFPKDGLLGMKFPWDIVTKIVNDMCLSSKL